MFGLQNCDATNSAEPRLWEIRRVAQWLVFSDVWNAIVDELRTVDLISDAEQRNLSFVHLPIDDSVQVCLPVLQATCKPLVYANAWSMSDVA